MLGSRKSIVVIRAHKFDAPLARELRRLAAAGLPIVVVADERTQAFETPGFCKVSLDLPTMERLELMAHPDAPWLCGDYALYLAAEAEPSATQFWLIDSDVRINFDDPGDFFRIYSDVEADFLGIRHQLAPLDWYWRKRMEPLLQPVYQELFGVLRISRPAVEHLHKARSAMRHLSKWAYPNDESFVATVLANGGFSCHRFGETRDTFPARTYGFRRLESGAALEARPRDELVHHAVLFGEDYANKALRQCRERKNVNSLEDMVAAVETELGPDRALSFAREAGALLASAEPIGFAVQAPQFRTGGGGDRQ